MCSIRIYKIRFRLGIRRPIIVFTSSRIVYHFGMNRISINTSLHISASARNVGIKSTGASIITSNIIKVYYGTIIIYQTHFNSRSMIMGKSCRQKDIFNTFRIVIMIKSKCYIHITTVRYCQFIIFIENSARPRDSAIISAHYCST